MPTLDTYRKQAKLLLRWHREGNLSVGEKIRRLDRFRSLTDLEALALKFTLAHAQEIVAVEAGHGTWATLKAAASEAPETLGPAPGPPVLKSVVPILSSRDVTACAGFYRDRLGFEIDFLYGAPPFYGAVSRDGVCLHLRFVAAQAGTREASSICATIEVSNVQALFEEFKARGVAFIRTIAKQVWGGTDFQVQDPDGNIVSFVTYRS